MAARKRALSLSTTMDQATKDKVLPLLTVDFMSSDESEAWSESGSSDENNAAPFQCGKKKRLHYHQLFWRSTEFDAYIKSLDRKIERRRSARSQRMVIPVIKDANGCTSKRQPPEGAPDWAISPFFEATNTTI